MDNTHQTYQNQNPQEIDLIDVAATLYRRRIIFVSTILVCIVLATVYGLNKSEETKVTALFETGKMAVVDKGAVVLLPLMTPSESAQLLELICVPNSISLQVVNTGKQLSGKVITVINNKPPLIQLNIEVNSKNTDLAITVVDGALNSLKQLHDEQLEQYKSKINQIQIENFSRLSQLQNPTTAESSASELSELNTKEGILSIVTILASCTNSKIVEKATSVPMNMRGPVQYAAGGFVLGLFVGCFVVFFLDVYKKAKIRSLELP